MGPMGPTDPTDPMDPMDPMDPRNGVTAGRSEPGNRAHTFRMTLVAQGKLPQNIEN